MAWAALLTSPFMPWSARTGHIMAQRVAEGRFDIEQMPLKSGDGRALLELLKKNLKEATPKMVLSELQAFAALLDFGDDDLAGAQQIFAETLSSCQAQLNQTDKVDWEELRRTSTPEVLSTDWETTPNREGVAVFQESGEPWRLVKHLFVLGFGDGHYPRESGYSPIFTDRDLDALNEKGCIDVATGHDLTAENRQLFKRQLGSATETITFLFSRKNPLGDTLQVSSTLPFMMKLFSWDKTAEQLVLEMDRREDRDKIRWLTESEASIPTPPRPVVIDDLDLEADHHGVWPKDDGSLREQSPSRLANLMTAPLAWLFDWIGIRPLEWEPETMDPATKGTLAHEVFEHLFLPNEPLPTHEEIQDNVPVLLQKAIRNNVPFLQANEWNVERNHLESDILKAALQWQKLLLETGIRVIGNEIKLYGELDGVPLKGFADIILTMPDGRIIVGDYKKSKSGKRKKQMEAGFDSQTSIYRTMLEKGRISSKQDVALPKEITSDRIGVLYYTMNDQVVLTDTTAWLPDNPDIKELGSEIATGAMTNLRQKFKEVRKGQILLNFTTDEKEWDKCGVKIYSLDNSPLLRMFMHTEEVSS
jgi:RecB family exonuclease